MKIGEVANEVGISKDAIRLYEKMGLINNIPTPNTFNNYKLYSEEHVKTLKMIVIMKKLGFTLKECKAFLESLKDKSNTCDNHNEFINNKLKELDNKIKELTTLRETLAQYLDFECDEEL